MCNHQQYAHGNRACLGMGKIKLDDFSRTQHKMLYVYTEHTDNQQQPATRTKLIPNNTGVVQSNSAYE